VRRGRIVHAELEDAARELNANKICSAAHCSIHMHADAGRLHAVGVEQWKPQLNSTVAVSCTPSWRVPLVGLAEQPTVDGDGLSSLSE